MMFLPIKRTGFMASTINQLIDFCRVNQIVNSPDIEREELGNGTALRITKRFVFEQGYPWGTKYTFGLERLAGNKVKVWLPKLRRLGDMVYTYNDTEVTFTGDADDQQIVWKWNPDDGLVIEEEPVVGDVLDDETWVRGILSVWNVENSYATLTDYVQCGQIMLPVYTKPGS